MEPAKELPQVEELAAQRSLQDLKALVPELGYRNYWYPGVRSKALRRKPVALRLLGEDLVLFRSEGSVYALADHCAHRGARLSMGTSLFPGTISCPYHGWTYNGTGQCVATLVEGPDSPMANRVRIRAYPAEERNGIVWVFMGEGDPPPLEEDIPADFLDPHAVVYTRVEEWNCNWRTTVENSTDGPVHAPYLHRNSPRVLFYKMHSRVKVSATDTDDGKGIRVKLDSIGFETDYPGLGQYPHSEWWRLLSYRGRAPMKFEIRMPGYLRNEYRWVVYFHWSVPIDKNHSRHFLCTARPAKGLGKLSFFAYYYLNFLWTFDMLFVGQDRWLCQGVDYSVERLSGTDTPVLAWRKLALKARGAPR